MDDRTPRFVVHPHEVQAFGFDWGRLAVTVEPSTTGSPTFSGGVVTLQPGQGHARHNHPDAEEIIFVVSGTGEQMVEDMADRPVDTAVTPGSTVYVPRGRFHSTRNTGDGVLQLFVVYSPAGPEQILRSAPDFRLLAAGSD